MKKQNGITLTSLVIYVIVMTIVLGVIGAIITKFYENIDTVQADTEEILQFNKFNTYFLEEVKLKDNKVDEIKNNYILFASGNAFTLNDNKIYYNNLQICNGVKSITFTFGSSENEEGVQTEDKTIINVNISFEKFNKSLNYKVEEIY